MRKNMKVCLVLKKINKGGGIPRVVSYLANSLCEKDDIYILSIEGKENSSEILYKMDDRIHIEFAFERICSYRSEFIKIRNRIVEYLCRNKFDVVIISGMDYVPFFIWMKKKYPKTQFIAWEHSNYTIGKKFGLKWFGRKIAIKEFDDIVVLTKRDRELYEANENTKGKISQIYNPDFVEVKDKSYNSGSKKIISCGALTYQKGFDYAIEVAKEVFRIHPDWIWDIWGEGEDREKLEKSIKNANLENNVFLRGFDKNVIDKYQDYAFFVLSSRYEGFCMVMIEAMKCGLPVIAFDCNAGPSETIGNNGFLVPCFDTSKMAEMILKMIDIGDKRKEFSKESKEIVKGFNGDLFIKKWNDLICK